MELEKERSLSDGEESSTQLEIYLQNRRGSDTFLQRARLNKPELLTALAQDEEEEARENEGPGIFSFGPPASRSKPSFMREMSLASLQPMAVVPEPSSPTSPTSGESNQDQDQDQDQKVQRKLSSVKSKSSFDVYGRSSWARQRSSTSRSSLRTSTSSRSTACRMIVEHNLFGISVITLIFGQSVYLCLENMETIWVNVFFALAYVLEQALRLAAYGTDYFHETWNLVDLILVTLTLVDLVLALSMGDSQLDIMVGLRLLRLLRLGGMVRLFRYFKQLWHLATGIMTSIRTVIWAWMLMGLVDYVFGLVFFRALKPSMCEAGSGEDIKDLEMYFGTVSKSWFTVFQIITLEDWPDIEKLMGRHISWLPPLVLLVLVTTTYGIMHVTVAIFVNSALEASSVRSQDLARKAKEEHDATCRKLAKVFFDADKDCNGVLSKEEFRQALEEPATRERLMDIGIDGPGAAALFDILDIDGSATLDGAEFVEGVLRSVGQAQNKDLIGLRCDIWRSSLSVNEEVDLVHDFLINRLEETTKRVETLSEDAVPILLKAAEVMQSKLQ